jgi:hypothetical protein
MRRTIRNVAILRSPAIHYIARGIYLLFLFLQSVASGEITHVEKWNQVYRSFRGWPTVTLQYEGELKKHRSLGNWKESSSDFRIGRCTMAFQMYLVVSHLPGYPNQYVREKSECLLNGQKVAVKKESLGTADIDLGPAVPSIWWMFSSIINQDDSSMKSGHNEVGWIFDALGYLPLDRPLHGNLGDLQSLYTTKRWK